MDPADKRLAVHVEDHPLAYATFKGTIPEGQYGAGTVKIWDHGTYDNLLADKPVPQTVTEGVECGRVEVDLHGKKLKGRFALVRMQGRKFGKKENWLLIKMRDNFARPASGNGRAAARVSKPAARKKPAPRPTRPRSKAGPDDIVVTHPEKIIYPDAGVTKGEVFDFYRRIAPLLLPHLHDRPVTLERAQEGLDGDSKPHFWQKDTPTYYPDWVRRIKLPSEQGREVRYALVNDLETLLYLVNQGTLTFHVWFSRVEDLDRPDFVLFDLDRGKAEFADVVAVARQLREVLEEEGAEPLLKTSGKTGLHVLVPWRAEGGYDEARGWATDIAARVVEALPKQATIERSKAGRSGRVYVDVMQNARGHHAVPPYVLRAVPGAPVSTPLAWRELTPRLDPGRFNIKTIFTRLRRQKTDPMAALTGADRTATGKR
jgi:bifunctional non-homologous end joining protein LigD